KRWTHEPGAHSLPPLRSHCPSCRGISSSRSPAQFFHQPFEESNRNGRLNDHLSCLLKPLIPYSNQIHRHCKSTPGSSGFLPGILSSPNQSTEPSPDHTSANIKIQNQNYCICEIPVSLFRASFILPLFQLHNSNA